MNDAIIPCVRTENLIRRKYVTTIEDGLTVTEGLKLVYESSVYGSIRNRSHDGSIVCAQVLKSACPNSSKCKLVPIST
jgi:hypothetical protein